MYAQTSKSFGVLVVAGFFLFVATDSSAAPRLKLEVCHQTGNPNNPHIIEVSEKSLVTHLRHGDWRVTAEMCDDIPDNNCDGVPTTPADDDEYCRINNGGFSGWTCEQSTATCIEPANEAPVITSDGGGANATVNAPENQTAVTTVTATDADTMPVQTLTFSISGGGDAFRFNINPVTGELAFNSPPDFENPVDVGGNNVYDIQVTVTDNGFGMLTDVQNIAVTVTDVNEAPVISSDGGGANATVNAAENQTVVTTVTATDVDAAQTLTFSISGGADAALFGIDGATGVLTFDSAPNFENALDAGGNNVYDVQVTVTDDGALNLTDVQDIAVTVTDVNEAPVITSDGGGANATVNAAENQTAVTTVTATDVDAAQTLTYSISGGADATLFGIDGVTGELTFNSAPNFENALDVGGNNVYDVQVTVTDDGAPNLTDVQDIAVTVTDTNEAPVITSDGGGDNAAVNAAENQTAVTTVTATDVDAAQTLTYSISGGADATLFGIDGVTGVLTFNSAPNFENALDAGGNNVYDVQVTVTDDGALNLTDVQDIAVTVTDANDAPVITSDGGGDNATVNADENQTAVTTVTATDMDVPAQTLTFSISGGADATLFGIDGASGVLTFNSAPDFENPLDTGGNNVYDVQVTVTDDGAPNLTDVQDIAVSVNDLLENEAPVITSGGGGANATVNAAENQTAVTTVTATDADVPAQTLTFSISGGADATLFGIDGATGVLTFNSAPNFENPLDTGGNNVYDVQVTVTDDGAPILTDVQDIAVSVTNANDDPTDIALDNNSVDENQPAGTAVGNFSTTDEDTADTHTYTLAAGTGDTDNAAFMIVGGQLQTAAILDYETATSCTTSATTCSIRVQTDDGNGGTYQEVFVIDITDANDAPTDIALDNNSVDENQVTGTAVGNFSTTDEDTADTHTYTLVAGAGDTDNAAFTIVGSQLQTAAIFDAGVQNSFSIRVRTDDGGNGGTYQESFVINIGDVNEDPTDIALDNNSVNENQPTGTAVGNFSTTDEDAADTHTYSLVSGTGDTDNAQFQIVGGQLQTAAVLDFEAATNCTTSTTTCSIRVQTDDGNGGTYQEVFVIDITDANDAPTDIALDNNSVDENQVTGTAVGNFSTTDEDTADTHTYTLVAGAGDTDNAAFMIVGSQLQTAAVLNFEAATSCTTSTTTCSIRVQTDDGNGGTYQESFIININDVNDPPVGVGDNYDGIGNTRLTLVAAPSGSTPVPPTVELVGTVADNDNDEDGDTVTAVAATVGTNQGGSVTIDANGRFVYSPPAGFTGGTDSFDYTPTDGVDTGSLTTVDIDLTNIVWYVDDSSPNNPGTGTSDDPFRTLSSASGPSQPGETIFVFAGNQFTGITLQANQSLLGEGVALVVNTITLVDAGARPVIANAGGTAVSLGASNTVRGLDIIASLRGLVGSSGGTLTANTMAINAIGGPGLDLTGGMGLVTLDSLSSSGSPTNGINLDSVSGSFDLGTGSISSSTGIAVDITNSTADISYDGSVTAGSNLAVNVSGHSANEVELGGLITSTGQGILANANTGGTVTFSGGMSLSTGALTAFSATNGGTINVCSDDNCETAGGTSVSNTVATTTGTAVAITTTIGSGGVTFDDVEVTGAASEGILVTNAGSGGFTVNGGMINNTANNGIRIDNTDNIAISNMSLTNAADDSGTCTTTIFNCNAAIEFNTVSTVDLTDVTISGSDEHGIFGTSVTDLDMTNVAVTNAGQSSEEHGIFLRNLLGTANAGSDSDWVNVDVANSGSNGIFVENTLGTTNLEAQPDLLTIRSGSSVVNHSTNSGVIAESDAAAANLKVDIQTGFASTNNTSRGVSANANAGRLQMTVNGATLGGGGHFQAIAGGSAAASANSELILNLTNNIITQSGSAGTGPGGIAFSSFSTGANNGTMRGTIQGNSISSAETSLAGISLTNEGNSTANRFFIDNNNIQLTGGSDNGMDGMRLESRQKQGGMDLVITNNTVNIPNNTSSVSGGIFIFAGNGTGGEANTVCIDMRNNSVSTPARNAAFPGFEFEYGAAGFAGNTVEVEGFTAPFDDFNLETYWEAVNTTGGTTAGVTTVISLIGGNLTSGNCVAP